jgi:hypothetical protein
MFKKIIKQDQSTKKFRIILIVVVGILTLFILGYFNKTIIVQKIKSIVPKNIVSIGKMILDSNLNSKKIRNDYNVKFLPETQFIALDFKKLKTNINISNISGYADFLKVKTKTFYIDIYKNELFLFYKNGKSFSANILNKNNSKLKLNIVEHNLKNIDVTDILINEDRIYLAGSLKVNSKCKKFTVYESSLKKKILNFTIIFQDLNCYTSIQAGKIQYYKKDKSIFVSTAANILDYYYNSETSDDKPQSDESLMGKIIKINNDKSYEIYSKGHRNIIGLLAFDDIVLATENGPRGGDEINLIKKGKNYGWPIASYGEKYLEFNKQELFYKKSHENYGYEEPIFSFIPSIGISEIIKIGNNFSKYWQDSFLVASLNSNHIYRINFDKDYNKIKFIEKIFIGDRIRDMKYHQGTIFLSLENNNQVGILKMKTN